MTVALPPLSPELGGDLAGLALPDPGSVRRLAWSELGARYRKRAARWPGVILADGASHVTVKALDVVEGHARRVLGIKANPPTYRTMVDDLTGALVTSWGVSEGLVLDAADDLAEIGTGAQEGKAWKAKARDRINALQARLAAEGKRVTEGELAETYTRYLAAAFLLGQSETTKPLGWEAGFSLVDQDAIAGLSRSGLWWIGEHYGDALDEGRILTAVDKMIRSGSGRVKGGEILRQALGAEFHRSDVYWRGLAATVATRARSFGALSGMEATGGTRYEYVNPVDERTSDVCRALDGTTFTVKGSIELRERLVGANPADSPEAWKAIAPWPKLRELKGPGGQLLDPAELQAKGIAWPPLHFHCRSSIDVVTWAPISSLDLDGEGAVERAGPRPPPAPAPGKRPKAPPAPPKASPWDQALAELRSAEDRAKAMGMDPDRAGLSDSLVQELEAMANQLRADKANRPKVNRWGDLPGILEDFTVRASQVDYRKAPTHRSTLLAEILDGKAPPDVYNPGHRAKLARLVVDPSEYGGDSARIEVARQAFDKERREYLANIDRARSYYARPELARKVRDQVEAHRAVQAAYRRAVDLAPREVRERWRGELTRELLADAIPSSWPAAKRQAVEAAVEDAWRVFPVDWLRLYRLEREGVRHDGRNSRAFASPSAFGGSITMNLGQLVDEVVTGSGRSYEPRLVGHPHNTIAHELGHRFDGIFGGTGGTGLRWRDRSDYPQAEELWTEAFGAPFSGQWVRLKSGDHKGHPKLVKLPWNEPHSKYQIAGDYVHPYEARVYAGGRRKPSYSEIGEQVGDSKAGGPVEFIAMAVQYQSSAARQAVTVMKARGGGESQARRYFKAMTSWRRGTVDLSPGGLSNRDGWTPLVRARALYRSGDFRGGLERLTGAGRRTVRELVETGALSFDGPEDVQAFALLVRHVHGVPVRDLVGDGGLLAGFLPENLAAGRLDRLEAAAKYLDGLGPADLREHSFDNLFSLTGPGGFEEALDELNDLAQD